MKHRPIQFFKNGEVQWDGWSGMIPCCYWAHLVLLPVEPALALALSTMESWIPSSFAEKITKTPFFPAGSLCPPMPLRPSTEQKMQVLVGRNAPKDAYKGKQNLHPCRKLHLLLSAVFLGDLVGWGSYKDRWIFFCCALLIPCCSQLIHGHINLPCYSWDVQSCWSALDKKLPITGIEFGIKIC